MSFTQCPMSVFLPTKPQFCVFPVTQQTVSPLSAILKLCFKIMIGNYLASRDVYDVDSCKYFSIQGRTEAQSSGMNFFAFLKRGQNDSVLRERSLK